MARILSTLVNNMYDYLNSTRRQKRSLELLDPLAGEIVPSGDYFQTKTKMSLSRPAAYVRVNPARLPEIVLSTYYLINDKKWSREHVNLSFKGFIDLPRLEGAIEDEMPNVEISLGREHHKYHVDGEQVLQINNSGTGIRRMIFFPHEKRPSEEALAIADILYDEACFIPLEYGGPNGGMVMVPFMEMRGEFRYLQLQELRKLKERIEFAEIIGD